MEYVLPYGKPNAKQFEASALLVGFDKFVARKFIYVFHESDIDIYTLIGDERISLLLYGWKLCELHIQANMGKLDAAVQMLHKCLIHYSLHIWFSKEWQYCSHLRKAALIYCLNKASVHFKHYQGMEEQLNYKYLLDMQLYPWTNPYITQLLHIDAAKGNCVDVVEDFEANVTVEDIKFLQQETLSVTVLRLVQLFNMNFMPAVLKLAIRTLIAWNALQVHKPNQSVLEPSDVKLLQIICHIYIMAVYIADSTEGIIVDHLLYNIRFYYKSIMAKPAILKQKSSTKCTAARHIALTCCYLQQPLSDFFESIVFQSYDECKTTLFGAVTQSYRSYVLGNLLMELNGFNDEDFNKHMSNYKRLVVAYVDIRERSEIFVLNEVQKLEKQKTSHNRTYTADMGVDWKSLICKGNRLLKSEEVAEQHVNADTNMDHRIDPVFQNVPKNLDILDYTYTILAKRQYNGWHFAKLVLLLKIVSLKLNRLESWRYHMGLTIDFIINLEQSIANHFEDLAKIFHDHPFMEQELWLTAFYLSPKQVYFETVARCGVRFKRLTTTKQPEPKPQSGPLNFLNAKYGLLSSTVDIKGIFHMSSHNAPNEDYIPLTQALRGIKLPESLIKDLLIVTFVPRHRHFSWAIQWTDLRKRCKDFLHNNTLKRRCVELNMAEANNRLKYLKVDYKKYEHRPMIDYGSIEEGYEFATSFGQNYETDSDEDDEDEEEEDFKEDKPIEPQEKKKKSEPKKIAPTIADSIFANTRRTRARVAAVIEAHTDPRKPTLESTDDDSSSSNEKPPNTAQVQTMEQPVDSPKAPERKFYSNTTEGFNKFCDIWNKSQIEIFQTESQEKEENEEVKESTGSMLPGLIKCDRRLSGFNELLALQFENDSNDSTSNDDNEEMKAAAKVFEAEEDEIDFSAISSTLNPKSNPETGSAPAETPTDPSSNLNENTAASAEQAEFSRTRNSTMQEQDQDMDSDGSDYSTCALRDSEEIDETPSSPQQSMDDSFGSTSRHVSGTEAEGSKGAKENSKKDEPIAEGSSKEEKEASTSKEKGEKGVEFNKKLEISRDIIESSAENSELTPQSTREKTESTTKKPESTTEKPESTTEKSQSSTEKTESTTKKNESPLKNPESITKKFVSTTEKSKEPKEPSEKSQESSVTDAESKPKETIEEKRKEPESRTEEQQSKGESSPSALNEGGKEKIVLRSVRVRIKRSPSSLTMAQNSPMTSRSSSIAPDSRSTSVEPTTGKVFKNCTSGFNQFEDIWHDNSNATMQPSTTASLGVKEKVMQKLNMLKSLKDNQVENETADKRSGSSDSSRSSKESDKADRDLKKPTTEKPQPRADTIESPNQSNSEEYNEMIEEYLSIEPDTEDGEEILPDESEVSEAKRLKMECLRRQAIVRIEKLKTKDLLKLRQPVVRIKRIRSPSAQRQGAGASTSRTTSTSSGSLVRRTKRKPSSTHSSTDEQPLRKRSCPQRYKRDDSTDSSSNSPVPLSTIAARHKKKLIVTPRSASGLKLRISSVKKKDGMEYMHGSSSASSTPPHPSRTRKYTRRRKPSLAALIELSDAEYHTEDDERDDDDDDEDDNHHHHAIAEQEEVILVDDNDFIPESSADHPLYEEEIII